MSKQKPKTFSKLLSTAAMALGILPGALLAGNSCGFDGLTVGADFLYWEPCISDMHYAVKANDSIISEEFISYKTHYICPDYDSGFRVYAKMDNIWCDFNAALIYTNFDTDKSSSVHSNTGERIRTTIAIPVVDLQETPLLVFGDRATAKWDFEYQTLDALMSYSLHINNSRDLAFEAFSGIKWLDYSMKRHDRTFSGEGEILRIKRDLDVCGIGPTFGLKSSYTFCGCFEIFGSAASTLIIAESENKDSFRISNIDEELFQIHQHYKNDDDCVCFPGVHLMTGIGYETCLCDMEIGFRLGWEYVHWINAPQFPHYDTDQNGARSGRSDGNITLQGLFAGLNVSF